MFSHLDSLDEVVGIQKMVPQADEDSTRLGPEDEIGDKAWCDLERYVSQVSQNGVFLLAFVYL